LLIILPILLLAVVAVGGCGGSDLDGAASASVGHLAGEEQEPAMTDTITNVMSAPAQVVRRWHGSSECAGAGDARSCGRGIACDDG
jgi:hypothetical protein